MFFIILPYAEGRANEQQAKHDGHAAPRDRPLGHKSEADGQHDPFHSFSPALKPRNLKNLGNRSEYVPS